MHFLCHEYRESFLSSFPVSGDRENDLAAHASMFHLLQGKGGLLERIEVVDNHFELSGLDQARNAPQQLIARLQEQQGAVDALLAHPRPLATLYDRQEP